MEQILSLLGINNFILDRSKNNFIELSNEVIVAKINIVITDFEISHTIFNSQISKIIYVSLTTHSLF